MSTAEYRLRYTEEYLLQAMHRYRKTLWWRGQYAALRWILAAALVVLLAVAVWGRAYTAVIVLCALLGALIGITVFGNPIDAWIAIRRLRKSPFHNNDLIFRISDNEIHITGTNEETHLKWSAFSKARRFVDGLLLFQGPHFFNWLPDSAAVDAASVDQVMSLAKLHVTDYRDG